MATEQTVREKTDTSLDDSIPEPVPFISWPGVLALGASVVVGLLLFGIAPYVLLERYCGSPHLAGAAPSTATAVAKPCPPAPVEKRDATGNTDTWERRFWCDLRGSDLALSLFTFLLVCATAGLIFSGIQQSSYMRRSWKSARAAAGAAKQQAGIAEATFLSTHRPRIRIKHLWLTSDIWGGAPLTFNLVIVNHGDTDARIIEMNVATQILPAASQLDARPEFNSARMFAPQAPTLPSGITYSIEKVSDGRVLTDKDNANVRSKASTLYCYGYVDYIDSLGRVRKTAFCRYLDVPSRPRTHQDVGRFVKVDDPDYEFAD